MTMGDKTFDGVGFAIGLERAIMAVQQDNPTLTQEQPRLAVWLVSMGAAALTANLDLAQQLRRQGIACGLDLAARSMKAQMRAANKSGATKVLIRGDQELEQGTITLKNMADGSQQAISLAEISSRLS